MGNPIAFLTCYHVCPEKTGSTDHVGGNIFQAARNTCTGGMPIARVRDKLACRTGSDSIETGSSCVFCEGQPVAFTGSLTRHLGELKEGNPTVCVGEYASCGPYGGLLAELLEEPVQKQQATSDSTHSSNQAAQDNVSQNPKTTTPTVSQSEPTTSRYDAPQSKTTDEDEDHELIVEVLGRSHPEGHKFCFFEREGGDPDPIDIKGEMSKEPTDDSVIYRWDWTEEKKNERRLFMEIATESGDPIRVPFLHQARAVERQEEGKRQKHVVAPVVVSTLISGLPKTEKVSGLPKEKNPHHHVLCRAGFLYFFYEDKLWREVEVTITEDGTPHYRDVPLAQYRTGEKGTIEGRDREVTGVALEEIWLPSSVLGYGQTVRAAYSESQWTDERINFFERYPGRQDDRCNLIEMEMGEQDIANGVDDYTRPSRSHLMPMSVLAYQRPRAPGIEREYDRPEEYLLTTSGDYETEETSKALSVHSRHEQADPYEPVPEEERPEMNALCNVLAGTMKELNIEGVEDKPFEWEKTQVRYIPLEEIKKRNIGVIRVDDHLYRVRYLLRRHEAGAWFADAAVRRAKERDFFDSASLVQTVVLPENIGGGPNPFYKHKEEMSAEGRQKLSFSLAEHERELAVAYLRKVQDELIDILNYSRAKEEIIELFTYYGCDYVGAFSFMTNIFQTVSKEPFECDPLHAPVTDTRAYRGARWVSEVTNGGNTAFHLVLFPDRDKDDLTQPYQDPDKEQTEKERVYRSSRGFFQASKLAELEDADLPEADSLKTLDGMLVLEAADREITASVALAGLRPFAGILMTVHGNLISALQKADKKALEAKNEHTRLTGLKSKEDASKLAMEKEQARLTNEIKTLEDAENNEIRYQMDKADRIRKLRENKGRLQELAGSMQQLDESISKQMQAIDELAIKMLQIRSNISLRLAHYLRAALPGSFGNLQLTSYSQAVVNKSFVLGVPAAIIAKDYDRFYKAALEGVADKETATKKLHAEGKGIYQEYRIDAKVLTMPENEETAKTLRRLSEAETEHARLTNELAKAKALSKDTLFSRSRVDERLELNDTVARTKELSETKMNRHINVDRLKLDLDASEQRLASLTTSAQAARDKADKAAANASEKASNTAYRALSHPIFPIGVLVLEGFNVYSMISSFSRELRISILRAFVKGTSTMFDFALLVTTLGNRFASNGSLIATKTMFLQKEVFKEKTAAKLARMLGTRLVWSGLLGVIGAVVTAIALTMDAVYALDLGNPAVAAANGLIATGVLSLALFGVLGKGGLALMLGAAACLLVGVAAIAVGIWLLVEYSDEPIQTWLRNGPFGPEDGVDSLKKSRESYQNLLSLCMGVSIKLERFEPGDLSEQNAEGNEEERERFTAISQCNARIVVNSPAISVQDTSISDHFSVKLDLVEETKRVYAEDLADVDLNDYSSWRKTTVPDQFVEDIIVLWEERTDEGLIFYINHPVELPYKIAISLNTEKDYIPYEFYIKEYIWQASAQVKISYQEGDVIALPSPDPEDNPSYDEKNEKHKTPDFSDYDQHFWHHRRLTYS